MEKKLYIKIKKEEASREKKTKTKELKTIFGVSIYQSFLRPGSNHTVLMLFIYEDNVPLAHSLSLTRSLVFSYRWALSFIKSSFSHNLFIVHKHNRDIESWCSNLKKRSKMVIIRRICKLYRTGYFDANQSYTVISANVDVIQWFYF